MSTEQEMSAEWETSTKQEMFTEWEMSTEQNTSTETRDIHKNKRHPLQWEMSTE